MQRLCWEQNYTTKLNIKEHEWTRIHYRDLQRRKVTIVIQ